MSNEKIAVVEDDAAIQRVLELALKSAGYRVETAGAGDLGLDLVKHVAQCHGGSASVDSEPGVRTRFRIVLPPARPA